ncbi:hypothetical protein niasHT_030963 [Heterodera trifolii]|uniref:Uncharacterized protein n=1 Tax=Heterodera trifolii TaxID=157864 RepID=A0ABD2J8F9_9BILA
MIRRRNLLHSNHNHHNHRHHQQHHFSTADEEKKRPRGLSSPSSVDYLGSSDDKMTPLPFVLKCPQTTKNVCAVLWSHNGTAQFSVFIRDDGQQQTVVDVIDGANGDGMMVEEKQKKWHTKDGAMALIFTAKGGRYKFEVETGGKQRKAWFMLRINEVNVKEDSGEWHCQLLVVDGTGRVKAEGESRKSIGDRWETARDEPARQQPQLNLMMKNNGRQMRKREEHHHHPPLFSFSFSKTDTEFVVFERMGTENGGHGTAPQQMGKKVRGTGRKTGDKIMYTRTDSVKNEKTHSGKSGHLNDDIWLMRWHSVLGTRNGHGTSPNKNNIFASAHQLQNMASALFVQIDSQKENAFLGKAFATLCCLMNMKNEADILKKDDELAIGGEVKAKLSNFCQKMKNGESIGKAAKSEAGKAIGEAAASNLEMNPQIYEQGLRKMEKFKILSPENRLEIGTFVMHCIHLLQIYRTSSKVGVFCVGPHLRPITRRRKKRANDIEKAISYSFLAGLALSVGYAFFIAHNKVDHAKHGLSSFIDELPDFTHKLAHKLTEGISDELAKMKKDAMIAAIVCFVIGAFSIMRIIILCCCCRRN